MNLRLLFFGIILIAMQATASDKLASLYQQGAYQEIVDTYEQHDNNAAMWCVIGNAAYCLGSYVQAYLYWLRAQRYGDAHTYYASTKNILALQSYGFVAQEHNVYTWLIWLSKYIGIYILQIIFLFVWYLLCVMIYKRCKLLLISCVMLLAGCLFLPIAAAYYFHRQTGLIMEDAAIYNGPNSAYYNVGSVPKGTLVHIKDVRDDWVNITYNDTIGWIGRTNVGLLKTHGFKNKANGTSNF